MQLHNQVAIYSDVVFFIIAGAIRLFWTINVSLHYWINLMCTRSADNRIYDFKRNCKSPPKRTHDQVKEYMQHHIVIIRIALHIMCHWKRGAKPHKRTANVFAMLYIVYSYIFVYARTFDRSSYLCCYAANGLTCGGAVASCAFLHKQNIHTHSEPASREFRATSCWQRVAVI